MFDDTDVFFDDREVPFLDADNREVPMDDEYALEDREPNWHDFDD